MYLIVSQWDKDFHPTSINYKKTEAEAQAIVDKVGGIYQEVDFYLKDCKFMTTDPVTKTISFDQIGSDANDITETAIAEINKREDLETPRRLAEAHLTAEGKTWLQSNRDAIATERAKL